MVVRLSRHLWLSCHLEVGVKKLKKKPQKQKQQKKKPKKKPTKQTIVDGLASFEVSKIISIQRVFIFISNDHHVRIERQRPFTKASFM